MVGLEEEGPHSAMASLCLQADFAAFSSKSEQKKNLTASCKMAK